MQEHTKLQPLPKNSTLRQTQRQRRRHDAGADHCGHHQSEGESGGQNHLEATSIQSSRF